MSNPIRGRTRGLTNKVEATVPMNIHNRFDVEVIDSRTGKIRQRAQAENVICSQLWTRLFTPTTYFNYIHYGTGNGTPATTDTHLFTFLGYGTASNNVVSRDLANCTYSLRRSITLSETTAVGATLTEVGIGYDTGSTTLCTHAMLKDMNGNQISIAKTNTDIINIYATVFVHWNPDLYSGNILINPNSGILGTFAGLNLGLPGYVAYRHGRCHDSVSGDSCVSSNFAHDAVNKKFTFTYNRLAASKLNMPGGYEYALIYPTISDGYYPYDTLFMLKSGGGWYPGTDIVGESIGTGDGATVDFATAFDFPANAKVYVDGVENGAVIVDNKPIASVATTDVQQYFEGILVENSIAYPGLVNGDPSFDGIAPGIYYNPLHVYGLKQIALYRDSTYLYASDDLMTWTKMASVNPIPEAYQYCKYWKVEGVINTFAYRGIPASTALNGKNIHFSTPPASGAVITADYHTPTIAKDSNHVFDLTVTIQLGEYAE